MGAPAYFLNHEASCATQLFDAVDWSAHPLGPPAGWPGELTTALALTMHAAQPSVLWWGPQLYQFVNDAYLAAVAEAPEEVGQGRAAQQAWPGTWPQVQLPLRRLDTGAPLHCDLAPLMAALGTPQRTVSVQRCGLSPLFAQDGTVAGAVAVGAPTSDALRVQHESAKVLDRMTDAFLLLDRNWTILRINAQHQAISKIPRALQEGHNFLQIFFASDPALRDNIFWHTYHKAMAEQVAIKFAGYYPPLKMWASSQVYPTAERGLAIFFRDITGEKASAESLAQEKAKLEAVFREAPASMALLRGKDLVFEKINARYHRLVGQRDIVGKSLRDALPELQDQPFYALMQQVMATGRPFYAQEMQVHIISTPGGAPEERYFDFSYHRIRDANRAPHGIFIHAKDVTERVRSRLKLVDALRARDELLSICSHELKTPVASMKLSTQSFKRGLARNDPRTTSMERVKRMVDQSDRQLDRLNRLIDEMLDFSRINGGRLQLARARCDLTSLVHDTLERLRPQIEAAGAQATTEVVASAEGEWDAFRLEQLITNLVTNAVKYGAGKPIHVTLQAQDGRATLRVQDHGPGIAPADHERIFRPYERAVSVTNISGLGLGLYISKQIAEAHGGLLQVDSAPGKGATFIAELPRRAPPSGPRPS